MWNAAPFSRRRSLVRGMFPANHRRPNPVCHLDAATVVKDGSDRVSEWTDISGNANHFVQATGADQPLWVDAVQNGHPVVRFAKANTEYLENLSPFLVSPAPAELFMVILATYDATTQAHASWSHSGSAVGFPASDNVWYEGFGTNARKALGAASGDKCVVWGVVNVAAKTSWWRCWHNETLMLETNTNTCTWLTSGGTGFRLGRSHSTGHGTVDIAEVRVYEEMLTAEFRAVVTAELRAKYAI